VITTQTGHEALDLLTGRRVDCLVLDDSMPDMTPDEFLRRARGEARGTTLPVILYSDRPPQDGGDPGRVFAPSLAFRQACSPERLLDQTAFFLHSPIDRLPEPKRRTVEQLYQADEILAGKKVLIVDDDIRNIFALTSILEWRNMVILSAETGRDAIRIVQTEPGIDIVLMDIMMPEMDGLDTMRVIRKQPQFNSLPIIAVTAKAMKGDREKCIEAGAWDYLSKPVDTEQLLSVLRVWLHR
jgi:CheY-like chemotaxis protein